MVSVRSKEKNRNKRNDKHCATPNYCHPASLVFIPCTAVHDPFCTPPNRNAVAVVGNAQDFMLSSKTQQTLNYRGRQIQSLILRCRKRCSFLDFKYSHSLFCKVANALSTMHFSPRGCTRQTEIGILVSSIKIMQLSRSHRWLQRLPDWILRLWACA